MKAIWEYWAEGKCEQVKDKKSFNSLKVMKIGDINWI